MYYVLFRNFTYGAQVLLILSFANGKLDFFDLIGNAFTCFYWFYTSYLCWFWDKLAHRFLRFKSLFFAVIQTEIFF
jgi:hypothetical protein